MELRNPVYAAWKRIDSYVQQDRRENAWFWEKLDKRPFSCASLEELLSLGLKVEFLKLENAYGWAESADREGIPRKEASIRIHSPLRPYNRDKTLFHELMHVWHGYPLNDGPRVRTKELQRKNTARTEWLARQARADPDILRYTLTRLRIKPWLYDQASYDAFHIFYKDSGRREDFPITRMD